MSGIPQSELRKFARQALPLMSRDARREAESLLADLEKENQSVSDAAAAFERDMQPVRTAIVAALQAGDVEALRGLRAMLPHLLAEVNESPELADVLAFQVGKALLAGFNAQPEDVV